MTVFSSAAVRCCLKHQSLFDLLRVGFSPCGLSFGRRLGEFALRAGKVAIEHRLNVVQGLGVSQSQFHDQPISESSPQFLDSSLGLRRAG